MAEMNIVLTTAGLRSMGTVGALQTFHSFHALDRRVNYMLKQNGVDPVFALNDLGGERKIVTAYPHCNVESIKPIKDVPLTTKEQEENTDRLKIYYELQDCASGVDYKKSDLKATIHVQKLINYWLNSVDSVYSFNNTSYVTIFNGITFETESLNSKTDTWATRKQYSLISPIINYKTENSFNNYKLLNAARVEIVDGSKKVMEATQRRKAPIHLSFNPKDTVNGVISGHELKFGLVPGFDVGYVAGENPNQITKNNWVSYTEMDGILNAEGGGKSFNYIYPALMIGDGIYDLYWLQNPEKAELKTRDNACVNSYKQFVNAKRESWLIGVTNKIVNLFKTHGEMVDNDTFEMKVGFNIVNTLVGDSTDSIKYENIKGGNANLTFRLALNDTETPTNDNITSTVVELI